MTDLTQRRSDMHIEQAQWEAPQPELLKLRLGVLALLAGLVLVALAGMWLSGNPKAQKLALLLSVPWTALGTWLFWLIRAELRHYRFALVDDGVLLKSGVLWRSEVFVPRVRIQHTDVSQGPLARRLNLATLVLHTAGVKQVSLQIVGLRPERARRLRDELLLRDRELLELPDVTPDLTEPPTGPAAPWA